MDLKDASKDMIYQTDLEETDLRQWKPDARAKFSDPPSTRTLCCGLWQIQIKIFNLHMDLLKVAEESIKQFDAEISGQEALFES